MKALLCTVPLDIGFDRSKGDLPIMPKIAIVSIVKWMQREGFTPDEYDFYDVDMLDPSDEEIREYFKAYRPTVIGLSGVVSTTYMQVKRITKIARGVCPNVWIVLGGSMSASANVILRKTEVDICVQGDGEIPWVEFLNYVKRYDREWRYEELGAIKGLSYLDPCGELCFTGYPDKIPSHLNPYPDYNILALGLRKKPNALDNYFRVGRESAWFAPDPRSEDPHRGKKIAALWATKGCVARCTFCQRSTKGYGVNSLVSLDEHLQMLKERFDVGFIQVIDENFGSDKRHAYEVAKLFKKHDLLWMAGGVRCISVNEDDVKFYHKHNCSALKFGVESGSQKILDVMEKNFTVEQVYTAMKACYKFGVYSPIGLLIGMPGETLDTVRETGVYLGNISRMIGVPPGELGIGLCHALPLPGTPLYQYGQQVGMIGRTPDEEEKYLIAVSDLATEKDSYINLNGSPMREVLFWEFLLRYEATRGYFSKPLGTLPDDCIRHGLKVAVAEGSLPTDIHGVEHNDEMLVKAYYPTLGSAAKKSVEIAHRVKLKLGKLKHPTYVVMWLMWRCMLVTHLNYKLVYKPWVRKIPRPLLEIPMKNLLYLEYLVRKALRRALRILGLEITERNIFNDHNLPAPITDKDLQGFDRRILKSLRHIVDVNRKKLFRPAGPTDVNQELLHMGR